MPKYRIQRVLLTALLLSCPCAAETPPFDRPGIGFSVTTLPARSFAWEQGLPDMTSNRDKGVTETLYSADTLLRAGLTEKLELQVSHAAYNYLRTKDRGQGSDKEGASGIGISFKYALPDLGEKLAWALLGESTLDTGNEPFSNGNTIYALSTTLERSLSATRSLTFYFSVDESGGDTTVTFSPSYNFALNTCTGAYVELGYSYQEDANDVVVGGAGFTWMATETVQLDFYADFGLTSRSTDLIAGFGVSVFID